MGEISSLAPRLGLENQVSGAPFLVPLGRLGKASLGIHPHCRGWARLGCMLCRARSRKKKKVSEQLLPSHISTTYRRSSYTVYMS